MYRPRGPQRTYKGTPFRPTSTEGKKIQQSQRRDQTLLSLESLEVQQNKNPRRPTKYKFTPSQQNCNPSTSLYPRGMSGSVFQPHIMAYGPGPVHLNDENSTNPYKKNYNQRPAWPYGVAQGPPQYINQPPSLVSQQWDMSVPPPMNNQSYTYHQQDMAYQNPEPFPQSNCYKPMPVQQFFTQPPPQKQHKIVNCQNPQTSFTLMPSKPNKPAVTDAESEAKEVIKKQTTPSRIFIAVNVHGIHEWSSYKSMFLPIFEIIGTLDSQVTTVDQGKTFILRDGQNRTIECVFYETDRPLIAMRRRNKFRCVGEFNSGRQVLLCVSVRQTSPEEMQVHRKLIAVTNLSLKKRVRLLG